MTTLKKRISCGLAAVMLGGAALVWAANPRNDQNVKRDAAPPKLAVNEKPIQRDGRMANSYAPIVKKVVPSVARIYTTSHPKSASFGPDAELPPFLRRFFGDQLPQQRGGRGMQGPSEHGAGSGVVVTKDGYLLTNNHVVDNADEVKVVLNDGREFIAKVIGRDPKTDLAVVKIDASNLPAVEIANSDNVEVGDIVLAVGNPFGIGETVTMGMVSATGRATLGLDYEDFIQTDAAINPGNSGGALVDSEGRLIGINTAILSRTGGNQGIGFAIPVNLAHYVMDNLVQYGRVVRGYLGVAIQDVTPALAKKFNLSENQGALVADITPGSPASKAGFENGDVVTDFNGKPVTSSRHLKLQVAQTKPGTKADVKILRENKPKTLSVKVGELPGEKELAKKDLPEEKADTDTLHGVAVTDLSPRAREELKIPANVQGALITAVEPDSPAANAGLKAGDVILEINRHPVKSAEDATKLTENPKERVTLVRVWDRGNAHYAVVDESKEKSS